MLAAGLMMPFDHLLLGLAVCKVCAKSHLVYSTVTVKGHRVSCETSSYSIHYHDSLATKRVVYMHVHGCSQLGPHKHSSSRGATPYTFGACLSVTDVCSSSTASVSARLATCFMLGHDD